MVLLTVKVLKYIIKAEILCEGNLGLICYCTPKPTFKFDALTG